MKLLRSAMFGIPVAVLVVVTAGKRSIAQDREDRIRTLTITNGDTVVNGKQLSKLSKKEQEKVRKELREMENPAGSRITADREVRVFSRKSGKDGVIGPERKGEKRIYREVRPGSAHVYRFREGDDVLELYADSVSPMRVDSLNRFHGRIYVPRDFSVPIPNSVRPGFPRTRIAGPGEKNSQTFYFNHTDNEGIATRISIDVRDAEASKVKEYSGKEKAELEVRDLGFAPRFSSGDMMIMFSLKGNADVKLFDSGKNLVFSGKADGEFSRKVSLPKNGVYYLVIDQNGRVAVKQIVKQ